MDPKSAEIYRFTVKRILWSEYAKPNLSEDLIQEMISKLCTIVIQNMTLKEVLTVAAGDKRFLDKLKNGKRVKRRQAKISAYTIFLRDYHKSHSQIPIQDRFKACQEAYKKLSEEQLRPFADLAEKENWNLKKGNGQPAKVPKREIKPISKVKGAKTPKDNKQDSENVASQSADERAKMIYKILQSEEVDHFHSHDSACHTIRNTSHSYHIFLQKDPTKRPVICKQDQVWLNSYEGKPQAPGTAYNVFLLEKSKEPEIAKLTFSQRSKMLGALWRQLDSPTKESYERKFAKIKAEYDSNYKKYLENLPEFRRAQETATKTRKRRASIGEMPEETVVVAVATPSKRPVRSKTIDCSSAAQINEVSDDGPVQEPTSVKAKKRKGESSIVNGESVEKVVSPKKVNGDVKKKKAKATLPEPTAENEVPEDPSTPPPDKKAAKKDKKNKLPEPVKPATSVKEYFKTVIYTGDPDKARKAYKKVSLEDKERYHKELSAISAKYAEDLNSYLKSLSKKVIILRMSEESTD